MKFIDKNNLDNIQELEGDIPTIIRKLKVYPLVEIYPAEYDSTKHNITRKDVTINENDVVFNYIIELKPEYTNLQNAYTEYLQLCQALGFNTKAGFQELFPALETLKQTNFNLSIELSVKLLAINSKIQYYGGTWDDCPNSL